MVEVAKLTFDFKNGCACAEWPLVGFTIEFQERIRNGNYDAARLNNLLAYHEADRKLVGNQYVWFGDAEYRSGIPSYRAHILA